MRGESKYHYVDLAIIDDQQEYQATEGMVAAQNYNQEATRRHSTATQLDFKYVPPILTNLAKS